MRDDDTLALLREATRILRDETLTPEERERLVDEIVPTLLQARFTAEDVRLSESAKEHGLNKLLALTASASSDGSISSNAKEHPSAVRTSLRSRLALPQALRLYTSGLYGSRLTWRYATSVTAAVLVLVFIHIVSYRSSPSAPHRAVENVRNQAVPQKSLDHLRPVVPKWAQSDRALSPRPTRDRNTVVGSPGGANPFGIPGKAKVTRRHAGTSNRLSTRLAEQARVHDNAPVATVTQVTGMPRIRVPGAPGTHLARRAAVLVAGSRIETGDADQATVQLTDGSTFQLGFNTVFRVFPGPGPTKPNLGKAGRVCELLAGTVVAKVTRQPPGAALSVRTPSAVARVLGTEFGLRVTERRILTKTGSGLEAGLWVKEGRVHFANVHGAVECSQMTESTASADGPPSPPRNIRYIRTIGYTIVVHTERLTLAECSERLVWQPGYSGLEVRDQIAPDAPFPWRVSSAQAAGKEAPQPHLETRPTVVSVYSGSPAERAGIRTGDVLVRVGMNRATSARAVQLAFNSQPPGSLDLTIRRGNTDRRVRITTTLTPGGQPPVPPLPANDRQLADAGTRLFLDGNTGEAVSAYTHASRRSASAGKAAALNNLGIALQYEGRSQEAVKALQSAVSHQPREALYRFNLGLALLDLGNATRSLDAMVSALALSPRWEEPWAQITRINADHLDRPSEALEPADRWIRAWPRSSRAWTARAHVLRLARRADEALVAARRALELRPVCLDAFVEAAESLRLLGEFKQSETMYVRAFRLDAGSPHLFAGIGGALTSQGRLPEGIAATQCALLLEPEDFVTCANLGEMYIQQGRYALAEKTARRAIALEPLYGRGYLVLCSALIPQNRVAEAEQVAQKAVETSQDRVDALTTMGIALTYLNRFPEAEARFREALVLDPALGSTYANLAVICRRKGQDALAEQYARKALELEPFNPSNNWELGMLLVMLNRVAEAEERFRAAYALAPDDPANSRAIADACRAQKKFAEAERFYLESIQKDPTYMETHLRLAALYEDQNRHDEAEEEFRAGAGLAEDKVLGWGQLALFQSRRHRADGGVEVAERCLSLAKDDRSRGMALGFMGLVRQRRNELELAERAFRESIAVAPLAKQWDRLAVVLEMRGKTAEAIRAYQSALALDPNDVPAKEGLARLGTGEKKSN